MQPVHTQGWDPPMVTVMGLLEKSILNYDPLRITLIRLIKLHLSPQNSHCFNLVLIPKLVTFKIVSSLIQLMQFLATYYCIDLSNGLYHHHHWSVHP